MAKSMYRGIYLKLKVCAFCGSEPILKNIGNEHSKKISVIIKCSNKLCRCEMKNSALCKSMDWLEDISCDAWNRRKQIE